MPIPIHPNMFAVGDVTYGSSTIKVVSIVGSSGKLSISRKSCCSFIKNNQNDYRKDFSVSNTTLKKRVCNATIMYYTLSYYVVIFVF